MSKIHRIWPYMFILLLLFSCEENPIEITLECVTGVVVGEKCGVVALQLDSQYNLGKTSWQKDTLTMAGDEDSLVTKTNVIGLLDLPEAFARENRRIYLLIRMPKNDENRNMTCYDTAPFAPAPRYMVAKADSVSCPKDSTFVE